MRVYAVNYSIYKYSAKVLQSVVSVLPFVFNLPFKPTDLWPDFYRAMLCIRGTSHGPVSVRPSEVGVLLKRLNVGSRKQHHTIAQGL